MQATEMMINGVDVQRLSETVTAVQTDPTMAQFKFRVTDQWVDGGHNRFKIQPCHGARQEHTRPETFVFDAGEPPVLLGTDQGANPVEYAMGALLGCMTTTMTYHAAARGIEIEKIDSQAEGDIDIQGMLQLDPNTRPGYQEIRVKMRVKTDGDPETLRKLTRLSPVFDTLANPVRIKVEVETY
jgi:uncharacterized OsmC-like protein